MAEDVREMMLTSEVLGDMPDVDAITMDEVLRSDGFGKFAILGASELEYIQACNDWEASEECQVFLKRYDSDPWILEFREGGHQLRAAGHVTLEQVRQAFRSYLAFGSEWRSGFIWAEVQL